MNIFRLAGDISHLLAIIILLLKIWKTRSCAGKIKEKPFEAGCWTINFPTTINFFFPFEKILFNLFFFSFIGISGKSQILFAITYISRYLDLVTTFVSVYNTVMKLIFISASLATLYLMYVKFRATYDSNHDSFRIEFLLIPCAILALVINHEFTVLEVSRNGTFLGWSFL